MASKLQDKLSTATHQTEKAVGKATGKATDAAGSAFGAAKGAGSTVAAKVSDVSLPTPSLPSIPTPDFNLAAKQAKLSGRAGRKLDATRAAAELSAEKARHAGELKLTRSKSKRATKNEAKAREQAEKAQLALEKRLGKAEKKLAKASRRRRRGVLFVLITGAGVAAAVAAKSRAGSQPTPDEVFPPSKPAQTSPATPDVAGL